jgi:hypothetical protein
MATHLSFPRSCERLGRRDFEDVFMDELQQQESQLNLQQYCQHGGFPDPESTNLEVSKVEGDAADAVVHVKCQFEESVPTSCGAISFPHPTFAEFTVTLSANAERGDVEYLSVYDEPVL